MSAQVKTMFASLVVISPPPSLSLLTLYNLSFQKIVGILTTIIVETNEKLFFYTAFVDHS